MKHMAKKLLKSGISLVLAFCMIVSMVMPGVAAETEKTTFNYVSLGASNTNGYGMRGYITEEELDLLLSGQVSKDDVNVYGYERKPEGSYPDLIRDYYTALYGADNVTIHQLAISSMRVEELRILLDDTYLGDDYSEWRFVGEGNWFESAEPGGLSELRKAYKENITNADLVTVDIGWNNFGVYVCNQLVDYMGSGEYKWTTDLSAIFDTEAEIAAAEEAKTIIGDYIVETVGEGELATALTDIFAYSLLGFMHNFDICMEKIYEMNPDADVVVLGIQNLLHGVVIEVNGEKLPLGDIFGNFVNMANYYTSACSPYQSRYQYVKAGTNEHVNIFLDYMKTYKAGTAKDLNQNVKDCFDYYDNDLYIQTKLDYVAADLIKQLVAEELGEDNLDLALQVLGCETWLDVVAKGKEGGLPTLMGTNYQETFDSMYWPALYAAYDTLAVLVKEIANYESVVADGLLAGTVNIGEVEDTLADVLQDEIMENAIAAANGESYTVDLEELLPDDDTKVVAAMYVRFYMGNSFFAHPDETGHKEIKDAVIKVINNPSTETDQALADYLVESVHDIHHLLCGAAGHSWDDATCTASKTCSVCGATDGAAPDHSWEDATCTTPKTCSVCGATEGEALGHTPGNTVTWHWNTSDSPVSAQVTFTCTTCNKDVTEDGTVTSTTTATCTTAGTTTYTASATIAGSTVTSKKTVDTAALGHTEVKDAAVAATCTEDGLTEGSHCSVCNTVIKAQETVKAGHTEVKDAAVAATCTEDGKTEGSHCSVCNTVIKAQETVKATGHDYKDGVCTVCSEKDPDYTEPTTPSDPEETDPTNPSEPEETDPTTPSEPTDPTTPSDPTDPTTPSEPTDPTKPSEPTDPTKPSEPEHKHSYGEWITVKDPTSKEQGLQERYCECGAKEQKAIAKLTNPFTDVKETDYYYEPVLWAVYKGVTAGVREDAFGPNNLCTRAQIVTFLWRAYGSPEPETTKNPFTDITAKDYYYKAVLWAVENGITSGVSSDKFGPSVVCTRAQAVTFLWRAAGSPEPKTTKNPFTDVTAKDYYYKAVLWAVENGVTAGMDATHFGSGNNCTRAQIVTFLYKAVN